MKLQEIFLIFLMDFIEHHVQNCDVQMSCAPRALLKAVYYTVKVHNFDLQEKTTENNNNTITAKWVKPKIVIELTNCKM